MRFAATARRSAETGASQNAGPEFGPSTAPSVQYHIERLVLDGVPLNAQQKQVLAGALAQELGSLLQQAHASHYAADSLNQTASGAFARLPAPPVSFGQPCDARDLGQQIARSIHAGVQGSGHTSPDSLSRSSKP